MKYFQNRRIRQISGQKAHESLLISRLFHWDRHVVEQICAVIDFDAHERKVTIAQIVSIKAKTDFFYKRGVFIQNLSQIKHKFK